MCQVAAASTGMGARRSPSLYAQTTLQSFAAACQRRCRVMTMHGQSCHLSNAISHTTTYQGRQQGSPVCGMIKF